MEKSYFDRNRRTDCTICTVPVRSACTGRERGERTKESIPEDEKEFKPQ